jgi:arylsulfatase A-like enzyme
VTSHAIHFLEARGDSDFFLFVHYYDPHWHYDAPHPFDRAFDPAYQGKATGIWWDFKELTQETIDPRDLHHIEALYDGEILYTDREVERLISEMKRLGLFENALLVVTSDHGEEFLDHGQWEHQKTLYEEQLRIPLLVKFPKGANAGRRVEGQVSLIDVAPTMLDALGIPAPPTFVGKSLQSAVRDDAAWNEDAWAETEHTLDGSRKLALRRGLSEEKAIFTLRDEGIAIELFDLAEDPDEKNPLDPRGRRSDLERRLRTYLLEAESLRRGKTLPQVLLRPEDLERLRSLGYLR